MGEPSCIDLTLRNNKSFFKHNKIYVTGISYFQNLIATATKNNFLKSIPKINTTETINILMLT